MVVTLGVLLASPGMPMLYTHKCPGGPLTENDRVLRQTCGVETLVKRPGLGLGGQSRVGWGRRGGLALTSRWPAVAPPIPGLPLWHRVGEQCGGLHQKELPRDAHAHAAPQRAHHTPRRRHAHVRLAGGGAPGRAPNPRRLLTPSPNPAGATLRNSTPSSWTSRFWTTRSPLTPTANC